MLFLNAGFGAIGAFTSISNNEVQNVVAVNAVHPIYTAKVLIDQMLARNHLSAIVVTSSGLAHMPMPGCLTYSASKIFADYLAQGLNYELKGKVDVLSWQCGEVSTKMLRKPAGGRVVTTEVAVKGMLRDLGKESLTYGCTTHARTMCLFMLPRSLISRFMFSTLQKGHAR